MVQPAEVDITTLVEACRHTVTDPARVEANKAMLDRYGRVFNLAHLPQMTAEEFKSFLKFSNNKHWWAIHRQGNLITRDMPKLREALSILLDDTQPLKHRLHTVFPKSGPKMIKGLGPAVATPILLVSDPDKYGVYNRRSEGALRMTGLWPKAPGASFAERYVAVNDVLRDLAQRFNLSMLQLDEILGMAEEAVGTVGGFPPQGDEDLPEGVAIISPATTPEGLVRFGVEKHLEDFLVYNWEKTSLGLRYDLLEEDGDITGQQYRTSVGPIDLLVREKETGDWVVIELKKERGSDAVVGQTLRYIGWVQENLAADGERVTGIVIAGEVDDRLRYALKAADNVGLLTYNLQFGLQEVAL